jgi:CelD/BcsL family acetyltransferase involved in cellulose biosynthesis/glycosyltransferase involved in cell wall biosynthesis
VTRPLTILSVAYPFCPVSEDSVGGAEQVLSLLERAIVAAGHRSLVVAHEASKVAGELVPIADALAAGADEERRCLDGAAVARTHAAVAEAVARVLGAHPVDLVHVHGIDFDRYLAPRGVPLLATLHLPVSWYSREAIAPRRPAVHLCCVSPTQSRDLPTWAAPWQVIDNGVALDLFRPRARKCAFALALGRICEEKAVHEALDACSAAGIPLVVAGAVLPWPAHRRYFERHVRPRLRPPHRWIGPAGLRRKRLLLAAARCLLVTSRAPETSSLVSMEALASGTPVIAYRSGALPEIVEHGRTGLVVEDVAAMARAIKGVAQISSEECRRSAEARFSGRRMTDAYLDAYRALAAEAPHARRERTSMRAPEPTTVTVEGHEALAGLAREWSALWERCPSSTPFQRPEWLLSYASTLCDGASARPWALALRRDGELVALLPLVTRQEAQQSAQGETSRTVTLLGDGISDYLDLIARPDDAELAAVRFLELLGARAAQGEIVLLDSLRGDSPLLTAPGPGDVLDEVFPRDPSPVISLAGKVDPLPDVTRHRLRRQLRRSAALGSIEFGQAPGALELAEWLEVLFRLHSARWAERGEPGVLRAPELRAFYRQAILRLAAAGLARLYGVRIAGQPAAAALVLRDTRTLYMYIGGFDPAYAAASPGTLVIGYAIDCARSERVAEIDFLRGTEAYKYRFGAEDRPASARRFGGSSPRSRIADRASSQKRAPVQPNGQSS